MLLRKFQKDARGSVAIVFGFGIFSLFMVLGVGLDFARAVQLRSQVQAAVDAAALRASYLKSQDAKESEIETQANLTYNANMVGFPGSKPTLQFSISDSAISISAVGQIPTTLTSLTGVDKLNYGVTSEALVPRRNELEAVLVLDYSSSMLDSNKYQTMRDAAVQLVDDLSEAGKAKHVRFGLVPFAKFVHAPIQADYIAPAPVGVTVSPGCVRGRVYPYSTSKQTPDVGDNLTKFLPARYTADASSSYDADVEDCDEYVSRNLTVRPLTKEFNDVKSQLQSMTPYRGTNISVGMEMGWHLITPNAPFSEGKAYTEQYNKKAIVLLSDGEQSIDTTGPLAGESVENAERTLEELCTNVKADGIVVVTVAYDLPDAATTLRLKNCATAPEFFFQADSNSDLKTAFEDITEMLAVDLRLTK